MKNLNIAVFFGGHSPEYSVSLASAFAVIQNLNKEKYTPVPVGITYEGQWFYYHGDPEKIPADNWHNDADCIPCVLSPDRTDHKLILLKNGRTESIPVDVAFPVMHGRYGEDGTIQGLIELAGIPLAGCGVLASALCMDKDRAHKLAKLSGIDVPASLTFGRIYDAASVMAWAQKTGYPLFVKPVKAGSSYGITKVSSHVALLNAVDYAFQYDSEVTIEENIDGFEVGCAVLGCHTPVTGEVDEIELSDGFFNFTEKYTLQTSAIHVPARISEKTAERVKETAKILYRTLGCTGFARVDMFLTPDERIVFNEINTIPGFTEHSRYPGMMKAAGISFPEILDQIIRMAVNET